MILLNENNVNKKIKINIFLSFLLKFVSVALNFILVPVTLNYLGSELYGVWIVLLSIISWITIFDIGIGNGLRNKLVECITNNEILDAKRYISTAYFIISLICISITILILILVPYIDWNVFFNSNQLKFPVFKNLMLLYLLTLVIYFFLNLITPILNAFQLSGISSIGNIISNSIFIFLLMLFKRYFINNISNIVFVYCGCLLFGIFILNFFFFLSKNYLLPSFSTLRLSYSRHILKLGGAFFIIQISALFIFTIDNYLILKLLGSTYVSEYNVVYKLFSIFSIGYNLIVTPYWSAFTSAYIRKDKKWIKESLQNLNLLLFPVIVMILVFIIFYQDILDIWLTNNNPIKPNISLVLFIALFTFISIWNNIYSFFLNGINSTKMQTKTAIIGAVFNVPTSYILVTKFNMGLNGIVLSMIISLLPFAILGPLSTKKIIENF